MYRLLSILDHVGALFWRKDEESSDLPIDQNDQMKDKIRFPLCFVSVSRFVSRITE